MAQPSWSRTEATLTLLLGQPGTGRGGGNEISHSPRYWFNPMLFQTLHAPTLTPGVLPKKEESEKACGPRAQEALTQQPTDH